MTVAAARLPPKLKRCVACDQHVYAEAQQCPHCSADLVKLEAERAAAVTLALDAIARLERLLAAGKDRG